MIMYLKFKKGHERYDVISSIRIHHDTRKLMAYYSSGNKADFHMDDLELTILYDAGEVILEEEWIKV